MPNNLPSRQNANWPEQLAFEIALGYYPPEELQNLYELTPTSFEAVLRDPNFNRLVQYHKREVEKGGDAFKLKARKFADMLLEELASMAQDEGCSATERRLAIEAICRYAGLDKQVQEAGGGQAFQVNIQFNQGG